MSSHSLPEVSENDQKLWDNSECKDCPRGDYYVWAFSRQPCTEKKRIVTKGGFCAVRVMIEIPKRKPKPPYHQKSEHDPQTVAEGLKAWKEH